MTCTKTVYWPSDLCYCVFRSVYFIIRSEQNRFSHLTFSSLHSPKHTVLWPRDLMLLHSIAGALRSVIIFHSK